MLDDPPVVPARGRLVLTNRTRRIEASLRRALGDLQQRSIQPGEDFDPVTNQRTFQLAAGDYEEMILASNHFGPFWVEAPDIRLATEPRLDRITDRLEWGGRNFAVLGLGAPRCRRDLSGRLSHASSSSYWLVPATPFCSRLARGIISYDRRPCLRPVLGSTLKLTTTGACIPNVHHASISDRTPLNF